MRSGEKNSLWWLSVVIGIAIVAAGIFLLVSPKDGNNVLSFLVGAGVFVFCLYNIIKAIQSKNDNRVFIPYLAHGLLDLVLFLLIIAIPASSKLLGVILACWMLVFGFFGIIQRKKESNNQNLRNGILLMLAGLGVLVLPFLFSIDQVVFIGVVALLIGVIKTIQGFLIKARENGQNSSGSSGLF